MSVSGFSIWKSIYAVGVNQEVCAMCRSDQRFRAVSLKSAALIALFAAVAGAQDFRAKLTVTVTDPAGMAVPSASLELRNASTTEVCLGEGERCGSL